MYTLEKVLKMKRDPVVDLDFLEIVMKVGITERTGSEWADSPPQSLDEKPSFTFWTTLAQAFETQTKEAARCESVSTVRVPSV